METLAEGITVAEAMELEEISRREIYNRMTRSEVRWWGQAEGRKYGRLIDPTTLSPRAQRRLEEKRLVEVQKQNCQLSVGSCQLPGDQGASLPPLAAADARGQLYFATMPRAVTDMQILKLKNSNLRTMANERFHAIQPVINHDYKATGHRSLSGLIRAIAAQMQVTPSTVRRWVDTYCEAGDAAALAPQPPGPPPGRDTKLDASMQAYLQICWEEEKLTKMQTYRKLNGYLRDKQRGLGASHCYVVDGEGEDFVSRRTVTAYLENVLGGENNPRRKGGSAIKEAAGYIDRKYDECSSDTWCIDEWELDGIFYIPGKRAELAQNPHAYLLTIIDERTTRILGRKLVRTLTPDAVLDLMEEVIRTFGRPKFLVRDKGGHFRTRVGGRMVMRKSGELTEVANGALGKLGVALRAPGKEKNPRANRIERATHGLYAQRAREDFGKSWAGTRRINKDGINLRELSQIDEHVSEHLREHCQLGTCGPVLLSLDDAERITAGWVSQINQAPTQAKGCEGLTRLAAYQQFLPPPEQWQAASGEWPAGMPEVPRPVSDAALLAAFSEDFECTIKTGGVLEVGDKPFPTRYSSAVLAAAQFKGARLRVTRARHDKSFVIVYPSVNGGAGGDPIRADRRVQVGTQDPEALARASAHLARTRRVLEQAARPVIDISNWEEEKQAPGAGCEAPGEAQPLHEMCGAEFTGETMGLKKNACVPKLEPESKGIGFADLE